MIWADRLAITAFVIGLIVFSYFLEALRFGFQLPLIVAAITAVIVWIVARALDFLLTGELRWRERSAVARRHEGSGHGGGSGQDRRATRSAQAAIDHPLRQRIAAQ
jgi:K+-sensing histidine kinase KdpD